MSRPTANSESTAARRAAMSGKRSERPATGKLLRQRAPRRDVDRHGSIRAASTSARPAARSTVPPDGGDTLDRDRARPAGRGLGRGRRRCRDPRPAPHHLQTWTGVEGDGLDVQGSPTTRTVLDELESRYLVLRGTIRDHGTAERRAFIRGFFACGRDLLPLPPCGAYEPLPDEVASGAEPLRVVGAMAGG